MAGLSRLPVTFTLSDRDVRRLRAVFRRATARVAEQPERAIIAAARALAGEARKFGPPAYVLERVARIDDLIAVLEDRDWDAPERVRRPILAALAYFAAPDDLIADSVPGLGFLDDAIAIELYTRELRHELDAYRAFARFRTRTERRTAGRNPEGMARAVAARRKLLRARVEAREGRKRAR
jgi:uncharacterized membrane protein YkvA (DUF1232 family)